MKTAKQNRTQLLLKLTAIAVAALIVISSSAMTDVLIESNPENENDSDFVNQSYQSSPCELSSSPTESGLWVSFDSSIPGTPAEAHVTISDTSGITIVADFHGFWRGNYTIDGSDYDNLDMPGASSIQYEGLPSLPCLFEYVEIPYDVDVSIEVLSSSNDTAIGYNIMPAPSPYLPYAGNESSIDASPPPVSPAYFDPVYSNDTFFPGTTTSTEGDTNDTSMIMRGHRLLGLRFYPVQFNPVSTALLVYSQLVIKIKYSFPAQIQQVPERLYSLVFERILSRNVLNYRPCYFIPRLQIGLGLPVIITLIGFEYLIITTREFKEQADRLAEWKERKGIRTYVWEVDKGSRDQVRTAIESVYNAWHPVPTYVLLLGDVEYIPANYDQELLRELSYGEDSGDISELAGGNIASDLGYFNIEGNSYLPDFVYGRISVDTAEQAEIIINKTLQYEQCPPFNQSFYKSILSAGYFQDADRNGVEDFGGPFIYTLEKIRHYLEDNYGYNVHINYSAQWDKFLGIGQDPLSFPRLIDPSDWFSFQVSRTLPPEHVWIGAWTDQRYLDRGRRNITLNINAGRFFVMCYDHGGSKNMIYPFDVTDPTGHDRNDRDDVEGLLYPFFNTSYFSDLTNGNMTPLVVMMACNTGWYDGETDQEVLVLTSLGDPNPFSDYQNECFAENITRLEGGGAIAAIASSRPAFAGISRHLLNGIVQAFWPGFLGSSNQPIYEMGAALLFGKLNAKREWPSDAVDWLVDVGLGDVEVTRTTFEEYHLFGDPELQLWTEVPSNFTVSYPSLVGISSPQRFAVTVRNRDTGEPVNFAKVCIQQESSSPYYPIYQVGYTDQRGQVTFDLTPAKTPSHINVTVTKHNFRPHIGNITVVDSTYPNAKLILSQDSGIEGEMIVFTLEDWPTSREAWIYFDDVLVDIIAAGDTISAASVPSGRTGYVNVKAVGVISFLEVGPVTIERFARISMFEGPDPYIYTYFDSSTWEVTDWDFAWDNPDIVVNGDTVTVIVHNRGVSSSIGTQVTLSYSPHLGGLTWHEIGSKSLPGAAGTTYFTFSPIPQSQSLRVDLFHEDESLDNTINNIGYDISGIIEMSSPGTGSFLVGNPTCSRKYVTVNVKQIEDYSDVWNATVQDYSSQALNPGLTEGVTLFVDSLYELAENESRLFEVEILAGCVPVCGIIFNATKAIQPVFPQVDPMLVIGIGIGIGIAVVANLLWYVSKRRSMKKT